MDTTLPRFHALTYRNASHDTTRMPKLHQRRDLGAGLELALALRELGYLRGEQIFNEPPREGPQQPPAGAGPFHVDLSFVGGSDVLLQCTRPPIHDIPAGSKRKIALAYTDLELRLFAAWKRYLQIAARNHMLIHPDLHPFFRPGFEGCCEMSFKQKGWGAPYHELNDQEGSGWRVCKGKRRTILFLLRLEHAWEGGPGYVCAFGMDGCTTLVWAYRLARDFKPLLAKPGFVMAELQLGRMPAHPTDLRFCMDWQIELVLQHEPARELALA